jgi:aspartyl protease family protein
MSGGTHDEGPWKPTIGGGQGPPDRTRLIIWICSMLAIGACVWLLAAQFPGEISTDRNGPYLAASFAILALVSGRLVFRRRINLAEAGRHAGIWIAIAAVLMIGYTLRDDMANLGARVRAELIPGYAVEAAPHTLVLTQNGNGEFVAIADVDGTPVRFIVDTGASEIVLAPGDAERAGIPLSSLHFIADFETANGIGRGAPYTLSELKLGPVMLFNVPVSINEAPMNASLLGMTFLRRMDSFEIQGRRLTLRWH